MPWILYVIAEVVAGLSKNPIATFVLEPSASIKISPLERVLLPAASPIEIAVESLSNLIVASFVPGDP
jgi:hypothetical protein